MSKKFNHELGDNVALVLSGEQGVVIGRAEYTDCDNQYRLRYKAADGRQVEDWLVEKAIVAADELKDVPAHIARDGKTEKKAEGKATAKAETKPAAKEAKPAAKGKAKAEETELSYDDVKAATLAASKANGREFVAGVLAQFGDHESAKTLEPEQWAEYLEALKAEPEDDDIA